MTYMEGTVTLLVGVAAAAACIGPQVEDEPGPGNEVLPAGSVLPDAEDDAALEAQIAEHDGVDGLVAIENAFANGASIGLWDFGVAPAFSAPVFVLGRRDGDGFTGVPHPLLVEVAPGDPGYSPYWAVFRVHVTDAYRGEVIPSVSAIDEAVRRGLVEPPIYDEGEAVNCPVVAADVRLAGTALRLGSGPVAGERGWWHMGGQSATRDCLCELRCNGRVLELADALDVLCAAGHTHRTSARVCGTTGRPGFPGQRENGRERAHVQAWC
jgi:hypothetical protein